MWPNAGPTRRQRHRRHQPRRQRARPRLHRPRQHNRHRLRPRVPKSLRRPRPANPPPKLLIQTRPCNSKPSGRCSKLRIIFGQASHGSRLNLQLERPMGAPGSGRRPTVIHRASLLAMPQRALRSWSRNCGPRPLNQARDAPIRPLAFSIAFAHFWSRSPRRRCLHPCQIHLPLRAVQPQFSRPSSTVRTPCPRRSRKAHRPRRATAQPRRQEANRRRAQRREVRSPSKSRTPFIPKSSTCSRWRSVNSARCVHPSKPTCPEKHPLRFPQRNL